MGLFDFIKRKDNIENQAAPKQKMVFVDNIYLIQIPNDWNQFESDKFRTLSKSRKINFVASNFGKKLDPNDKFTIEELKKDTSFLFDKYVKEGGYEAIDDYEVGKDFVYQAFKVDHETQYYYFTSNANQELKIQ